MRAPWCVKIDKQDMEVFYSFLKVLVVEDDYSFIVLPGGALLVV
jgi:hypothetical protein